jgi:hypothetical protein
MSFQVIEKGGPMRLKPLSDLRVKAPVAVDESAQLPADVVEYIMALESHCASMEESRNREFLRSTWEARKA